MKKRTLTVALAAVLAAAMPLGAQARSDRPGRVVHAAPHVSHPAPHFTPHFSRSAPRFTPHFSRSTPHFTRHVTRSVPHFTRRYARPTQRYTPHFATHPRFVHRAPRIRTHRQVVHRTPHVRTLDRAARRLHRAPIVTGATGTHVLHAQPNLQRQTRITDHRSGHRFGTAHVTAQMARQGRFASRFEAARARGATLRTHPDWVAARRAWRHHRRAAFVAWYGPVFWPYAYSDIFDYAFWPYGYDEGYWYYAYDDFFDGVFWGEFGPPEEYVYGPGEPSYVASRPRVTYAGVQELCREPGTGITAWPFAQIERKIGLDAEQRQSLNDVREAAKKAAATFKVSCPSAEAFPLTPPGRLQAMTARLSATLEAVDIVRPPLTQFYNSLSDEQKARFNQLGPNQGAVNAEASAALPDEAKACKEAKPGLTNLPIDQIDNAVKPTDAQVADLDQLQEAVGTAVSILQAACPNETPLTPPGRLDAIHTRLKAMIDAANTVKPALDAFYGSLSNEQKARFNRLGRELARTSSND